MMPRRWKGCKHLLEKSKLATIPPSEAADTCEEALFRDGRASRQQAEQQQQQQDVLPSFLINTLGPVQFPSSFAVDVEAPDFHHASSMQPVELPSLSSASVKHPTSRSLLTLSPLAAAHPSPMISVFRHLTIVVVRTAPRYI